MVVALNHYSHQVHNNGIYFLLTDGFSKFLDWTEKQ